MPSGGGDWPRCRTATGSAVELRHVHGLSYEEVAVALDRPVNTVKTHVHRGVALLRTAIVQEAHA